MMMIIIIIINSYGHNHIQEAKQRIEELVIYKEEVQHKNEA
jgi:hypothetical protein